MNMISTLVLVAEDERVVAMDLASTLQALGYTTTIVYTGRDAVARALDQRPHLVLMDIRLQGDIDGIAAAAQIRAQADIPVIYLTAHTDDATRQRAGATIPYGYLAKPFDERSLQTTIEVALIRHAYDRQIQASEQWLRTTMASIDDGIITTDALGQVTYMNPRADRILGVAPDRAIGQPVERVLPLWHAESGEQLPHPVHRALETGAAVRVVEALARMPDGADCWIEDSVAPIVGGSRQPIGAVMVFRDAGARRQAERERLAIQQRQEEIRHLERLRVLAGGAAHDLNNLLTGIFGYVEIARFDRGDDAAVERSLAQIEAIGQRAADLTQQFLDYAGRQHVVHQEIAMAQVVRDVLSAQRSTSLRGVQVDLQLQPDLPAVRGDSGQIYQIVQNLVINAAEAMAGREGILTIAVGRRTLPGASKFETMTGVDLAPGDYLALDVRDQGVGIDAEARTRIFEPFYTSKFTGRGLGLAVVLGNTRTHGGSIEVSSTLGEGTQFRVLLPIDTAPPVAAPSAAPAAAAWRGAGMVLLIDDQAEVRDVARRMLERLGFSVQMASSGAEGLAIVREQREPFACLIIDVHMQALSGIEVVRQLRALGQTVPIVLTSGYSRRMLDDQLTDDPQVSFLMKPFAMEQLRDQMQLVLARPS